MAVRSERLALVPGTTARWPGDVARCLVWIGPHALIWTGVGIYLWTGVSNAACSDMCAVVTALMAYLSLAGASLVSAIIAVIQLTFLLLRPNAITYS